MTGVQGHCDPRFDKVQEALAEEIDSGEEVGASIAVDIDGELVVDIWAGHADAARTREWSEDTIVNMNPDRRTTFAYVMNKMGARHNRNEAHAAVRKADLRGADSKLCRRCRILVFIAGVGVNHTGFDETRDSGDYQRRDDHTET